VSLRSEIQDQPEMLRALDRSWVGDVERLRNVLGKPRGVLLVGRGTSDNAARFGQYLLGIDHGLPSALATPSLYSGYLSQPAFPSNWMIVAISQSGASPDLAAVVGAQQNASNLRVAITNNPESLLGSVAEIIVPMGAGSESAVAATKTYVASLCAVLRLSDAMSTATTPGLGAVVTAVERVLEIEDDIAAAAASVAGMESCAVVGRGLHMASAFEWALKVTETSSLAAVPFSSADFLHGPVAMIDADRPLLAVVDDDPFTSQLADLVGSLSTNRNATAIVLSFVDDVPGARMVRLPSIGMRLNPIIAAVALQLFSLHLAIARGSDPDDPRGLSKVTETL
jgi:glucosamine--fructose-6-phosphate aminotransferase (isomerizing)